MKKNSFYELDKSEKIILFTEAAQKEVIPFAVEKDWWVVRKLEVIFKTSAVEHLMSKGFINALYSKFFRCQTILLPIINNKRH